MIHVRESKISWKESNTIFIFDLWIKKKDYPSVVFEFLTSYNEEVKTKGILSFLLLQAESSQWTHKELFLLVRIPHTESDLFLPELDLLDLLN